MSSTVLQFPVLKVSAGPTRGIPRPVAIAYPNKQRPVLTTIKSTTIFVLATETSDWNWLKMASLSASSLLSGALCSQLWVSSPLCNRHWRLAAWLRWKAEKVSSSFLLRTSPASSLMQVIFENGLPVKWRVHILEPVRARGTKGEFRFVFFQRNLLPSWWDVWTMEIRLIFFWKGSMTNHSWIAYCISFRQFLLLVSNYISNSSSLGPTSKAKMTMGYSRSPCSPA